MGCCGTWRLARNSAETLPTHSLFGAAVKMLEMGTTSYLFSGWLWIQGS
jgi:hypothetical protein